MAFLLPQLRAAELGTIPHPEKTMLKPSPVVLHVEDDADLAEVVQVAFKTLGFHGRILIAGTVSSALSIVKSRRENNEPLDLILVDVHLPDGSGLEIIRVITSNPA